MFKDSYFSHQSNKINLIILFKDFYYSHQSIKINLNILFKDSYWIANGFIWDWLLLPVLPLGEVLKQDVATSAGGSGQLFPI